MSNPTARAIASVAICGAAVGVAWAAPVAAGMALPMAAVGLYVIWANA